MNPPHPSDAAVRLTNDEAFAAKLSAVAKGYLTDPYALALAEAVAPGLSRAPPVRQPMINRGTFARVTFVRRCVARFLAAAPPGVVPQVVSLGAGFDTLPFVVLGAEGGRAVRYVEMDFEEVVRAKCDAVAGAEVLAGVFEGMKRAGPGLVAAGKGGSEYCVAACDLRDVEGVRTVLDAAGVDRAAPTVFIAECVLVYMQPEESDALVQLTAREFTGLRGFVNYEPVEPGDAFGEQMVRNIALRGSPLLGIERYKSVTAQRRRFEDAGFAVVQAMSMLETLTGILDEKERKRLQMLEMLDEFEEFRMMMEHYCVVWARADPVQGGSESTAATL